MRPQTKNPVWLSNGKGRLAVMDDALCVCAVHTARMSPEMHAVHAQHSHQMEPRRTGPIARAPAVMATPNPLMAPTRSLQHNGP
jgi:hypothetical protein